MSTFKPDLIVPSEWYGFDFNRTLAEYHSYTDDMRLARPLPMVAKVKEYLALGRVCKILTAQVWWPRDKTPLVTWPNGSILPSKANHTPLEREALGYYWRAQEAEVKIRAWCLEHIGQELEVTCERDRGCQEVWDDKAWHVIPNVGHAPKQPFVVFEEHGPWPPPDTTLVDRLKELMQEPVNVMSWGSKNMRGLSTFSDAEVERSYWNMISRRSGIDDVTIECSNTPAAQSLIAYCNRFHKPPFCIFENEFTRAIDSKLS